jgi:ApaG protein
VIAELEGLNVTVDKIVYSPHLDAPMDRPFPFVYHISIHNDSDVTVTIRGRKWVVTEQDGTCVVVEGDGVVGKFPRLEPGERFSYSSYHVIASDSVVEGAYLAVIENGGAALARIPMFELKKPV